MTLDSPEAVGGGLAVLLGAAFKALTAYLEWRNRREQKRVSKIPPSPQFAPPPTDHGVLERLDRAEYESALSVLLVRERGVVDDLRRELMETRAELAQITVELRAERALTARLRQENAKLRQRARTAAVELPVAPEQHQDASQAGPLQDQLDTVRPPRR